MKTALLFSAANAQLISFGKSCYKAPLIADFDLERVRHFLPSQAITSDFSTTGNGGKTPERQSPSLTTTISVAAPNTAPWMLPPFPSITLISLNTVIALAVAWSCKAF